MKSTVSLSDFRDAFQMRKDQFSYEGLEILFEYLEEYEKATGEEIELDVIDLCCEYTEYKNLAEFQQDYDSEVYQTIDDIEDHTPVMRINDESFIILQF